MASPLPYGDGGNPSPSGEGPYAIGCKTLSLLPPWGGEGGDGGDKGFMFHPHPCLPAGRLSPSAFGFCWNQRFIVSVLSLAIASVKLLVMEVIVNGKQIKRCVGTEKVRWDRERVS